MTIKLLENDNGDFQKYIVEINEVRRRFGLPDRIFTQSDMKLFRREKAHKQAQDEIRESRAGGFK